MKEETSLRTFGKALGFTVLIILAVILILYAFMFISSWLGFFGRNDQGILIIVLMVAAPLPIAAIANFIMAARERKKGNTRSAKMLAIIGAIVLIIYGACWATVGSW
ncbi:hypothetical protein KW805_04675 [Candidatus Pacearchaeota archaeon]|nr:hypothetical protein [Candidatus Pacearchaeota archaeon]